MKTLLLDLEFNDLVLDASGNIALAGEPYATAQSVANAIKVFAGEVYYDTSQGIPYLTNILGQRPSMQYIKSQMEKAAMTVPGVVSAACSITGFKGRSLGGHVLIADTTGVQTYVQF